MGESRDRLDSIRSALAVTLSSASTLGGGGDSFDAPLLTAPQQEEDDAIELTEQGRGISGVLHVPFPAQAEMLPEQGLSAEIRKIEIA